MGTIADKFEYLLDTKAAIKDAIASKGVMVDENAAFRSFAASIESINSWSIELKDVNFHDYDGTLLYSYTIEEAQTLQELPPLPQQDGLICQGWNWSLADIKAHGKECDVGATYITDDGKTRIYITLSSQDELMFSLKLNQSASNAATVDWGDGSTPTSYGNVSDSFYATHTYSSVGDYCIEVSVADGKNLHFIGSASTNGLCKTPDVVSSINLGLNTTIGTYAFQYCTALASITIPNGISAIDAYAFYRCCSLSGITLPSGTASIDPYGFCFCTSLASIAIPNSVTTVNTYAFNYCSSLASITLPNSATFLGGNAFSYCTALKKAAMPTAATFLGSNAFTYCTSLTSITIPKGVATLNGYLFKSCTSLKSITIPNGVTTISVSTFHECTSLKSIILPGSVTKILNDAFNGCTSLKSITIPRGVTSIGDGAFSNGYFRCSYHFQATTPPTLSGTGVFNGIASDCIIYVPTASINAYKTTTRWSTHASKIVGE